MCSPAELRARLLVEGRALYSKKDYEGATRLAYASQKLHGSYGIWDLGDRPSKLVADCHRCTTVAVHYFARVIAESGHGRMYDYEGQTRQ